jgi:hypothetical protein
MSFFLKNHSTPPGAIVRLEKNWVKDMATNHIRPFCCGLKIDIFDAKLRRAVQGIRDKGAFYI